LFWDDCVSIAVRCLCVKVNGAGSAPSLRCNAGQDYREYNKATVLVPPRGLDLFTKATAASGSGHGKTCLPLEKGPLTRRHRGLWTWFRDSESRQLPNYRPWLHRTINCRKQRSGDNAELTYIRLLIAGPDVAMGRSDCRPEGTTGEMQMHFIEFIESDPAVWRGLDSSL